MNNLVLIFTLILLGLTALADIKQEPSADLWFAKGEQYLADKVLDTALVAFENAAEIWIRQAQQSQFLLAKTRSLKVLSELGRYTDAVNEGESLIREYQEYLRNHPTMEARIYGEVGKAYSLSQADNFKGMKFLNFALSLAHQSGEKDAKLLSDIYSKLGSSKYFNLEYDSAIYFNKRSIEVYANNFGYNSPFVGENYRGVANGFWGLGQLDSAAYYIDQALSIYDGLQGNYADAVARVLHSRGYLYLEDSKNREAYLTFRKAAQLYESKLPSIHPTMIWIYGDVGRVLYKMEAYDSALYYYQKALIADVYNFNDMNIHVNPKLEDVNDEFQFFMVLKLKAQALAERYLLTQDNRDKETMLDAYMKADAMIDKFRKGVTNITDHNFLNFAATEICSQAFQYFVEIYEMDKDEIWLDRAHYFSEKHNLSVVHSNFLENAAKGSEIIDPKVLEQEESLQRRITELKSNLLKLLAVDDRDSVDMARKELFLAQRDLGDFMENLAAVYPSYQKAKYDFDVVTIKEVQKYLSDKHPSAAFINFFERQQFLHVSVITKDYKEFFVIKSEELISEDILVYRASLIAGNDEDYVGLAAKLYDKLMTRPSAIFEKNDTPIDRLIIVPTRSLQLLPFETLKANEGTPFLLEQYDINYQYSATLLVKNGSERYSSSDFFVGMAPSFTDTTSKNQGLIALPGSEKEVNALAEMLKGEGLVGPQATEESFKNQSNQAGLLHLATHAQVDEVHAENSFLVFSNHPNPTEDGKLHFFEIYDLKFNAQLVTLSACNTGFGQIKKGEGVMSLSRAFAYAGVPATVVSLWPASDKSTPELMKYFYQNLKKGQNKSLALNNARKQYLANATGKARHPFYWGGFVVIGDDSPISSENSYVAMILSILFLLTAVPIVLVIKNKYLSID